MAILVVPTTGGAVGLAKLMPSKNETVVLYGDLCFLYDTMTLYEQNKFQIQLNQNLSAKNMCVNSPCLL